MRKETIKTLQGDCHVNEKNNEIGGPNNSIKKRNERIIEAYQTENTSIAELVIILKIRLYPLKIGSIRFF